MWHRDASSVSFSRHIPVNGFKQVPIRALLTFPVLFPILVLAIGGWLSWWHGQQTIERLALRAHREVGKQVLLGLDTYLAAPRLVTQINHDAVRLNQLDLTDLPSIEHHFQTQLLYFQSVSSILIATEPGLLRSVSRHTGLQDKLPSALPPEAAKMQLKAGYDSTVQQLSWYQSTILARRPIWSLIAPTADQQDLALHANHPLVDPETGRIIGVASSSILLSEINRFLNGIQVGTSGVVFIVERNGNLIGTSTEQLPYQKQQDSSYLQQISAADSPDALIRETTHQLLSQFEHFSNLTTEQQLIFQQNGSRKFVWAVPYRDQMGLDWLIILVTPEMDFVTFGNSPICGAVLLCLGIFTALWLLGMITNWLAKPRRSFNFGNFGSFSNIDPTMRQIGGQALISQPEINQVKPVKPVATDLDPKTAEKPQDKLLADLETPNQTCLPAELGDVAQQIEAQPLEFTNSILEAQVQERTAQLCQALATAQAQVKELERLHHLKDDFLNTVSHELRTPIANIKMGTQLLEMSLEHNGLLLTAAPIARYLQILKDEAHHEMTLINNLLDLSRLDAGIEPYVITTIDPYIWIPHVVEPFLERTRIQQQQLQLELAPGLPPLTTDLANLERILSELLHNACKYTPAGEKITITASVSSRQKGEQVESNPENCLLYFLLKVTNSGVEIPEGQQSHIFEKFYRIASHDPWQCGGTGLGLALVKGLVERLSGQVWVESNTAGTSFVVQLPLLA